MTTTRSCRSPRCGGSTSALSETAETVESTCLVGLQWPRVAFTAPATGRLVVAVDDSTDATVAYQVTRTTEFEVFAVVFVLAVVAGAIGARILWACVKERNIPPQWAFKDGWASSLTGLTSVAAGLFALGGVLAEYAPQYSTAGALAANLVVLVLVGMAPVAFAALAGPGSTQPALRRAFAAAGGSPSPLQSARPALWHSSS